MSKTEETHNLTQDQGDITTRQMGDREAQTVENKKIHGVATGKIEGCHPQGSTAVVITKAKGNTTGASTKTGEAPRMDDQETQVAEIEVSPLDTTVTQKNLTGPRQPADSLMTETTTETAWIVRETTVAIGEIVSHQTDPTVNRRSMPRDHHRAIDLCVNHDSKSTRDVTPSSGAAETRHRPGTTRDRQGIALGHQSTPDHQNLRKRGQIHQTPRNAGARQSVMQKSCISEQCMS